MRQTYVITNDKSLSSKNKTSLLDTTTESSSLYNKSRAASIVGKTNIWNIWPIFETDSAHRLVVLISDLAYPSLMSRDFTSEY